MNTIEKEIQCLKEDLQEMKKSLQNKGEKAAEGTVEKLSFLRPNRLRSMAYQAGKEVSSYMRDKGEQMKQMVGECEGSIKRHPFIATTIAFAAGAIIISLFRRK